MINGKGKLMNKSEFRALINECIMDALRNNAEVRAMLLEVVRSEAKTLVESASPQLPKEPENPDLYDKLMLIAQGKINSLKHAGKSIKSPNLGNGFKSSKTIKEWTDKAYTKIGGTWVTPYEQKPINTDNIRALQSIMGIMDPETGAAPQFLEKVASGNDRALKEELSRAGLATTRVSLDSNDRIDIMDLLIDTAKTTLVEQESRGAVGPVADSSAMKVAISTPDQIFGTAAVSSEDIAAPGSWASMAFGN